MAYAILQSSTESALLFLLVLSSDHVTGATGKTPTVTLSKNGGAFASPSGAVTEIANGWYKVAGNATDTNTLGPLALHATASLCDPTDLIVANIVAYDPQDGATVADIASAVWDEVLSSHTTTGSSAVLLTSVKAVTASIPFSGAGHVQVDVKEVNSDSVTGAGTSANPWGPA